MGEDFICAYEPQGGPVIEPLGEGAAALPWSPEAEEWLTRVPPFVRRFVRQRAEGHVRAKRGTEVTAEVMAELAKTARSRFGERKPGSGAPKS